MIALGAASLALVACVEGQTPDCSDPHAMCGPGVDGGFGDTDGGDSGTTDGSTSPTDGGTTPTDGSSSTSDSGTTDSGAGDGAADAAG